MSRPCTFTEQKDEACMVGNTWVWECSGFLNTPVFLTLDASLEGVVTGMHASGKFLNNARLPR